MLDLVFQALELLGPTLVGILTVPVFGAIKKGAAFVDNLPAWVQQIAVVVVAGALSAVGTQLDVLLPGSLSLFAESDVSALLSAAMAYGIHAGKKASARGT